MPLCPPHVYGGKQQRGRGYGKLDGRQASGSRFRVSRCGAMSFDDRGNSTNPPLTHDMPQRDNADDDPRRTLIGGGLAADWRRTFRRQNIPFGAPRVPPTSRMTGSRRSGSGASLCASECARRPRRRAGCARALSRRPPAPRARSAPNRSAHRTRAAARRELARDVSSAFRHSADAHSNGARQRGVDLPDQRH
jgi:hypothetical protein